MHGVSRLKFRREAEIPKLSSVPHFICLCWSDQKSYELSTPGDTKG